MCILLIRTHIPPNNSFEKTHPPSAGTSYKLAPAEETMFDAVNFLRGFAKLRMFRNLSEDSLNAF